MLHLTRRALVRFTALLGGAALTGCTPAAQRATAIPTPTRPARTPPPPTPTAVPRLDTPGAVAAEYLRRWSVSDYAGMYQLVASRLPGVPPPDAFVSRYANIAREATITQLTATLDPGQRSDVNVQRFGVTMETTLTGQILQRQTMTLSPEREGWRVQWLPSLIFTQLSGGDLVHMFPLVPLRGAIVGASEQLLATQGPAVEVSVISGKITDEPALAARLSSLLDMSISAVRRRYREAPADVPVRIRLLSSAAAVPIRQELSALPAVRVRDLHVRTYPFGSLAAATIGYLGVVGTADLKQLQRAGYQLGEPVGRAGVEAWGELYLAGGRGGRLAVTNRNYDALATIAMRPARPADRVTLTIDHLLQAAVEDALGPREGGVVVSRIADGALLTLGSTPGFDPNEFILGMTERQWLTLSEGPAHPLEHKAVGVAFPAGPAAHLVALGSALAQQLVTPDSHVTCTGSWTPAPGAPPLPCWKPGGHGTITAMQALAQSCWVGAYQLGRALDDRDRHLLPTALRGFGLGKPTGLIGVPEASGLIADAAWIRQQGRGAWSPTEAANLAAGLGDTAVTALQAALLIEALATGQSPPVPTVVARATAADGSIVYHSSPATPHALPFGPSVLATLRNAMPAVGNGLYGLAGPTVGNPQDGCWFLGFATRGAPDVALTVFLAGGVAALPATTDIARTVLARYRALPTA